MTPSSLRWALALASLGLAVALRAAAVRAQPIVPPPPPAAAPTPPAATATATTAGATTPSSTEPGATVHARTPSREVTRRELTAEEIQRLPGTRGDALMAVQDLPGVARPQFGLGQFVVRSSPPEDTLVTLEGMPIVLPFHFYGLASTIATDLIDRVEFLPGNFSARYGRVAGGVINVELNAPPRDRVHANVDLDVIDAGAYASAPLGRNASVAVGARRSLIDLIGPAVFSSVGGTSFRQWPFYWDAQLVLDWDITPRDSLRIIAAANDDQLILNFTDPDADDPNLRGTVGTDLGYAGLQARWRHRFAPGLVHTFAPGVAYNIQAGNIGPNSNFRFQSVLVNLRDELEWTLTRRARVFLGLDGQVALLDNTVRAPPISTSGITDPIDPATLVSYSDRRTTYSPAAYAEAEIDATRALRILAGVRVDYFSLQGTATVNPRAMVRVAPVPRVVFRAGVGLYSTPPRGYYIIPGFGNPNLQPEQWLHATAGAALEVVPGMVDFDTDAFVKLGDAVVSPTSAMQREGDGTLVPERFANTGRGRVVGGEWLLRVRPGRAAPVYGLVSYTYQQATRAACPTCAFVTYDYDQPHIFTAVLGALLPYGIEAGVRVRYTSGIVSPTVTGALFDADHDVAITLTDPLNPGRLPPFFSLDARIAKRFRLGPVRGQAVLEVLNATNNNNAESVVYSYDRRTSQLVYGLPIIPSLGVRAEY